MNIHPCTGNQPADLVEWEDVQALLRWALSCHPQSALLKIRFSGGKPGDWLRENVFPASAKDREEIKKVDSVVNVAFSATGLKKLGIDSTAFPFEFNQGIYSDRATRVLGDHAMDAPLEWDWGGSEDDVDVVLLIFSKTGNIREREINALKNSLKGIGALSAFETNGSDFEHFGFRDGISNPRIRDSDQSATEKEIAAGEFIYGYADERGMLPPSPLVPDEPQFSDLLRVSHSRPIRSDKSKALDYRDAGQNGSFLVIRQLRQWAHEFNAFANQEAKRTKLQADLVKAKMMGRWQNGTPLTLYPDAPAPGDKSDSTNNDFLFNTLDAAGDRCPLGAHIRRANPRDTLTADSSESLAISNRHRILRRGRPFGESVDLKAENDDDDKVRGLMFLCFNVSFARQFEHVQHTWINSERFATTGETDPVIGERSGNKEFTIPQTPLSPKLAGLAEFVRVIGGGYFFFPGLRVYHALCGSKLADPPG